ncbi:hypothetical protein [Microbacterium rhizophilus]|uniref:hypothetical protein n=1 Tax=Microbacterium rhizophilus TaxID=3138934 RepID=UPI0031F13BA2
MTAIQNTARATKRLKLVVTNAETQVEEEWQGHVQGVELPVPQQTTTRFGDGNSVSEAGVDQKAIVKLAQDTDNEASPWRFMRKNAGKKATLIVWPHYDGTYAETVVVTLAKPPLNTDVTVAGPIIHTVTMDCDGEPVEYTGPAEG